MSILSSTLSTVNQCTLEKDVNSKSTSNEQLKPKGILKNATSSSYNGLINQLCNNLKQCLRWQFYLETRYKKNNKEKINDSVPVIYDNTSLTKTSSTSTLVKRVTFKDMTHDINCKLSKSTSTITIYSHNQERNSQNLHLMNTTEKNSDEENSIHKAQFHTTDSSQFEKPNFVESSDDEQSNYNFY
ncbi:unnamed protein product [Rotaria sp. Silwood1]|nr:unnamed protein product [Rotaria sp. Silwood1]CAF3544502.1 unnamed protein product [Rotaria sp. Silwood1]CAF4919126.1 unnamed protein product [Rotaria sp. Silwood1]